MQLKNFFQKNYFEKKNKNGFYLEKFSKYSVNFKFLEKWLKFNLSENLCFRSKLECYLKNLINIECKYRSLNSHFFLINLRLEKMEKIVFFLSKILKKIELEFYTVLVPFNSLIVIPIKQLNFFNLRHFLKEKLNKDKKRKCYIVQAQKWKFKIKEINYLYHNINFLQVKMFLKWKKIKKKIYLISYLFETINSLFESFSFCQGISILITLNRNFYCVKIMLSYFRAFFYRLERYKYFFLKKRKFIPKNAQINFKDFIKNQIKIDPMLATVFRFDPSVSFIFYNITSKFLEILSSNNNIPFVSSVRLNKNPELFRKKINYETILFSIKKLKKKESNYDWLRNNPIQNDLRYNLTKKDFFIFYFLFKKAKDFYNEQLGAFNVSQFDKLFREGNLDIWLNPFLIQFSDLNFGSIEVIPNSITFHYLHKIFRPNNNIKMFQDNNNYEIKIVKKKKINFIQSLAGYSLLCFFIQLKDRHNNNILINSEDRVIHIDFGFILGDFPGLVNLEADFFKLTKEFFFKIGGINTEENELFIESTIRGFFLIKKNMGKFLSIFRRTLKEKKRKKKNKQKLLNFQRRFKIPKQSNHIIKFALSIINKSLGNWKTNQYDRYQFLVNKIE
ncbi:phosphatidylinositol 4-kinase (nucleomorph) [Chroomonas mesostigmatica CCMP1168]|uniref:Phosphatidylinositol 4-kinase n=1 Tax=Chroomonas mesostigmatica CCMP1168 TaxID=1195612 RepID=J7GAJ7_9CRYP|nr:phosphatidylinositol 4-kinase [Chroomonas mesostigmatica CCMP1168]